MRNISFLVVLTLLMPASLHSAYAQQSEGAKTAGKIGLSVLPGLEMPKRETAYRLDTANFRPENFSFRIWDKMDLTDRLELDVPLPPVSCKPSWGLFVFRVNALGKVDSTWYRGNLPSMTTTKILANICSTEGNWIVKPGTKPSYVAWFAYPFFDIRGRASRRLECPEAEQNVLEVVSSLANLFAILYYRVDHNFHRAIMVRPSEMDGSPKL